MHGLLLLLTACAGPDGLLGMSPPPAVLRLEAEPPRAGLGWQVTVRDAPPLSTVFIGASALGLGPGPCIADLGGLCLDLRQPTLAATLTADANGVATWTTNAPPSGAMYLQAAVPQRFGAAKSEPRAWEVVPAEAPCHTWTAAASSGPAHTVVPAHVGDPAANWSVERLFMRRVTLDGAGDVQVTADGLTLWTAAGQPFAPRLVTDAELPLELYIHGEELGERALVATPVADCPAARLPIEVGRVELAGHSLTAWPHIEHVRGFYADEAVEVALDPVRYADRIGVPFGIHVVPHRDDAAWAADPTLSPVAPPTTGTMTRGTTADNVWTVLQPPLAMVGALTEYDVVVDFGLDGRLDPEDLRSGEDGRPGLTVLRDPSEDGPLGWQQTDVNFGGVYLKGRVYAPDVMAPGERYPLVVISHGNGHDYRWYDYLGHHLASWGYVVYSHASNTMPGPTSASMSLKNNIDRFLADSGTIWNGRIAGRLDGSMSWIGHSRGGEAVVLAYDDLVEGRWMPAFGPDDVRTIHSIAPTVFEGVTRSDPHDVAYHLLAGAADGDVTGGVDCPICQFWRIPSYADGRTLTTYVHGAGHNDFHDGNGWFDATGPDLIGKPEAQRIAKGSFLPALQWFHRGQSIYEETFTRTGWHPSSWAADDVVPHTWIPDVGRDAPLVVDDFQTNTASRTSSAGGPVTWSVAEVYEGLLDDANGTFSWVASDKMNGATQVDGDGDERGLTFEWDQHAWIEWALPQVGFDLRDRDALIFRVAQATRHPRTEALDAPLGFGVTLRDRFGRTATVRYGQFNPTSDPYERTSLGRGTGWADEFSTVRVHLSDFLRDGAALDMSAIAAVRMDVGAYFGSPEGRVVLDDLMFVTAGEAP